MNFQDVSQRNGGSNKKPGRILIVEDEPDLAEMLEYSLQQAGFETLSCADGFCACRLIERQRPDVVLLDIMLPELDGWEVCRLLRSVPDESTATTPVIMLTALDALEQRVRGLELGADAYVTKPYALREVMAHIRNLTARRRRDEEKRKEVGALRDRDRLRKDIQSLLFHELRNHLLVIGGFSNLLIRGDGPSSEKPAHDYVRAIHRSSNYLSLIADEFHLVRHIENGRLVLKTEPLVLSDLVNEVVALFAPFATEKNVALELRGWQQSSILITNRAALKVVLCNLVDNAIKYSAEGEKVTIVYRTDRVQGLAGFSVIDCGPGISPNRQRAVFEKFVRGEKDAGARVGAGLGLYVVRTLVESLGGRVVLNSRPGSGSCFEVLFPQGDYGDYEEQAIAHNRQK
ncbi:MAG: response regulator [Geoalkalibacter sp.]|jgi:signal transduction histidine kinase|uniref:hybrid sensor histidine kinase/response regulator n=1 Tax=Geoalkalibacter sp. TaxID=3041440 RepID=UPI002A99788C|nr:response regulator [Thermodesulfobacteriota bacterium]